MGLETQNADIQGPRYGEIIALTIDATCRAYDTSPLSLAGGAFRASQHDRVFVTMFNDGTNTIYYAFSATAQTGLDDTQSIAAGQPLAYNNAYAIPLPAGQSVPINLDRKDNQFLIVKCAAGNSSVLRFHASSQNTNPRGATA